MSRLTVEDFVELNLTVEERKIIEAVSPVVSLERTEDGALIIIKDVNGTHQVLIYDGQQGVQGEKGEKGDKGDKGDPGEVTQAEFDQLSDTVSDLNRALNALEPTATSADVGKFLKAKTVEGGKVTEYELEEAGLPEGLPTEETAQELLAQETYNTGLTDSTLAVIGAIFNGLPQDEPATDILNSLSLECERLQAIYENWMSERSA